MQRLATMVIVGLVALSTILVLYLADESNRIDAEEKEQQHAAIERATANYMQYCLSCHGPAGEGSAAGDGRIGLPLNTSANQTGINAQGTPVSGGLEARETVIRKTIHEGRAPLMPAWGEESGGALNDEQIEELVYFIQHVDWNHVYNEAIEENEGEYPAAPPRATTAPTESTEPAQPNTYHVEMVDIAFVETELVVPANTDITINLTNTGAAVHNFHIEELGVVSNDLAAGETQTLTFNTGAPGEYEFFCAIPGHREAGMVGKIIVTDDPSLLPAPAEGGDATPAAGGDAAPADGGEAANPHVEMVDIAFVETEVRVPANTEITIDLTNTGAAMHNFHIEELGVVSPDLASGETGTVTFNTGAPGEYEYFCAVPGHREAGMVGKLIVE